MLSTLRGDRGRLSLTVLCVLLLVTTSVSPALAAPETSTTSTSTPGTITALETLNETDVNNDGVYRNFDLYIEADTRLPASNDDSDGVAEPRLKVYLNGEVLYSQIIVESQQDLSGSIPIPRQDLPAVDDPALNVTVVLWEDDPLVNDILDVQTLTVPYETDESDLASRLSRNSTTTGSPVYVQVTGGTPPYTMTVTDSPVESTPGLEFLNRSVGSIRPDVAGDYTVRITDDAGIASQHQFSVEPRAELLDTYAPRLHYASDELYQPTRYEAFVKNARLIDESGLGSTTLVQNPSMFDLVARSGEPVMDLLGYSDDFQQYDDEYPPTVYGSVHDSVTYNGNEYTGVTYWLFYVYDPKSGGLTSIFSHQGDLETVSILINESGPQWVAASQHYGGEIREWEYASTSGTHLDVYPALGAHSTYLVDTSLFDGDGLLGQQQFAGLGGPELLSDSIYTDTTGNETTYVPPGSSGDSYEIVPLQGDEVWAGFNGGFADEADSGQIPMQRQRWSALGTWAEQSLYADERQRNATLDAFSATYQEATNDETARVSVSTTVTNNGLKPTPLTIEAVAKPSTQTWESQNVTVLSSESVYLGTNRQQSLSVSGSPATAATGAWDVRLRVGLYETAVTPETTVAVSETAQQVYEVQGITVVEQPAQNLDDDPLLEDINGDGRGDVFDALSYYRNRDSATISENPSLFDFDGDGQAGTVFDALELYEKVS